MQRVAHNADLITGRLRAIGWRALTAEHHDLRTRPSSSDQAVFARVEEISGAPVPPTLLTFWRVVGGIDWVWDYDAPRLITYLFDEWIYQKQEAEPGGTIQLRIDLAPDYLHKANYSGGGPYCIEVPFIGADPLFADERHGLPFLDYLRLAFRWSGFPRLDQHAERHDVQAFVAKFGKGLEPF